MGVFDRQIASAQKLIAKNGMSLSWRQFVEPTSPDPTPWHPDANVPTNNYDVKVVVLPQGTQLAQTMQLLMGSDVIVGRDYGLMGAVDFVPNVQDQLYDGTELFRIIRSADVLAPNGDPILYKLNFEVA